MEIYDMTQWVNKNDPEHDIDTSPRVGKFTLSKLENGVYDASKYIVSLKQLIVGGDLYPTIQDAFNYAVSRAGIYDIYLPIGTHDLSYVHEESYRTNINFIGEDRDTSILNIVPEDIDAYEIDLEFFGTISFSNLTFNYNKPDTYSSYQFATIRIQGNCQITNCSMTDTSNTVVFWVRGSSCYIYDSLLKDASIWLYGTATAFVNSTITCTAIAEAPLMSWGGSNIYSRNMIWGGKSSEEVVPLALQLSDGGYFSIAGSCTVQNVDNGVKNRYGSQLPEGYSITFNNVTENYVYPVNEFDSRGSLVVDTREGVFSVVSKEYLLSAEFGNSLPTTDPLEEGKLWNNSGILTISVG